MGRRLHQRSKKVNGGNEFKQYYNPQHPGSFCGVSGFLKNNKKVDRASFKRWAEEQNAITQHSCARKRFPRRRVLVFSTGELFQIDLMDFQSLSSSNEGYKYVLVAIDAFSKFAWAVPLKRKTAKEVLHALKIITKDLTPRKITCDRGSEFYNQRVTKWLKANKIDIYSTFNSTIKSCIIERFIRTFKARLYRYFTQKTTEK